MCDDRQYPGRSNDCADFLFITPHHPGMHEPTQGHEALGVRYRPIRIPRLFWKWMSSGVCSILRAPNFLPAHVQGHLWRLRLLTRTVFWCDSDKTSTNNAGWTLLQLQDTLPNVLA